MQKRLGLLEGAGAVVVSVDRADDDAGPRRADERIDVSGVESDGALEQVAGAFDVFDPSFAENLQAEEIEIDELGLSSCSARRALAAISSGRNWFARRDTISSWVSNGSAIDLSKRSAQRWAPVVASMSWALTRRRLPPRWSMLPSRM